MLAHSVQRNRGGDDLFAVPRSLYGSDEKWEWLGRKKNFGVGFGRLSKRLVEDYAADGMLYCHCAFRMWIGTEIIYVYEQ